MFQRRRLRPKPHVDTPRGGVTLDRARAVVRVKKIFQALAVDPFRFALLASIRGHLSQNFKISKFRPLAPILQRADGRDEVDI